MNTNKILLFFAFIFTTFASAQVGIGTQNPQGIFNIDGGKNNATSGAPTAVQQVDDFVVTAAGNVGIGTTIPAAKLSVNDDATVGYKELIRLTHKNDYNTGAKISWWAGTTVEVNSIANELVTYAGGGSGTTGNMMFSTHLTPTGTTEKMRITGAGNVGIGTTTPSGKLHVRFASGGEQPIWERTNSGTGAINATAGKYVLDNLATPSTSLAANELGVGFAFGFKSNTQSEKLFAAIKSNVTDYATQKGTLSFIVNDGTGGTDVAMTIDSNKNVGIGTTAPDRILSVVQAGNGTAFISNASTNLMRFESTANSSSIGHFFKAKNAAGTVKEIVTGINPNSNSNNGVFFFGLGTGDDLLGFDLVNYNSYVSTISGSKFGIGTKLPATKLEVNGAATNTTSISRTDRAIDYIASNLAGTTASAGAFTLTNLKDGGAYTLAIKGTTVGTCTFTATNIAGTTLTVHLQTGHGATTSGTHTLYNFIVIGTDVYVTWMTGL